MNLAKKLVDGIHWDTKEDAELAMRIERIAIALRRSRLPINYLWEQSISHNIYATSLAWHRMSKNMSVDNDDLSFLKEQLEWRICEETSLWFWISNIIWCKDYDYAEDKNVAGYVISKDSFELDDYLDPDNGAQAFIQFIERHKKIAENTLLAALFMDKMNVARHFFKLFEPDIKQTRMLVKRLECTKIMPQMCIRLLLAALRGTGASSRVVQQVICNSYVFKGTEYEEDCVLQEFCKRSVDYNQVFSLRNVLKLFPDISLMHLCKRAKEDFFIMAKSFNVPLAGIRFYYDLLKAEGYSGRKLLEEVSKLCVESNCDSDQALNNYLYLCWKLQEFPMEADKIIMNTKLPMLPDEIYVPLRTMAIFVNDTFLALLKFNPNQILKYLIVMGRANPFLYDSERPFKKHKIWSDAAGKYYYAFNKCIKPLLKIYKRQEVIDIYMNSGLKSMIDFHALIKRVFAEEFTKNKYNSYIDLKFYLEKYRFIGQIHYNKYNYRVSVSSVNSSYQFPIHINWSRKHEGYIRRYLPDQSSVSFVITHVDKRRGMIFASNVQKYIPSLSGSTDFQNFLKTYDDNCIVHFHGIEV